MKKYNFDEIIERKDTGSVKVEMAEKLFGTTELLPMWVADMDFRTPDFIVDAVRQRSEHEIYGYTLRPKELNESIKNWVRKRHGWQIETDWISFSPGVVPALAMCVLAYTRPGDKIVLQSPVYHPFFSTIQNNGRQLINNTLELDKGQYVMDLKHLESQIDKRTKMLFLCNPHNPVGRVWSADELAQLAEICLKYDLLVISDEIHSDLVFSPHKHTPLASLSPEIARQTITCIAPSKTFNAAGLSSSALIIPDELWRHDYENVLDNLHLYMGNLFGGVGMAAAYRYGENWLDQLLAYLKSNLNLIEEFVNQHLAPVRLIRPQGTYLAWLDFRELGLSPGKLQEFLVKKAKVGFNNGITFGQGGEGFMRMNFASPRDVVQEALNRIHKALKNRP